MPRASGLSALSRSPKRRLIVAFLVSFAVYLIPLVHGHGGFLHGMLLITDLTEGLNRKPRLWVSADIGIAFLYQAVACFTVYWALAGGFGRWALIGVPAIGSVPLLYTLHFLILPSHFLIEADTAPELVELPVLCTVEDAAVAAVDAGPNPAGTTIWVRMTGADTLAFGALAMPACVVTPIDLPDLGSAGAVQRVAADGAFIYSTVDTAAGLTRFHYRAPEEARPAPLEKPDDGDYGPVLSRDGRTVAWLYWTRTPSRRIQQTRFRLTDMRTGAERDIELAAPKTGRLRIVDVDAVTETIWAVRSGASLLGFDFDGNPNATPVSFSDLHVHDASTLRLSGAGLVFWDGYRESGLRSRLRWIVGGTPSGIDIPMGRSITDVAVSADLRYIAVSVTTALNIGRIPDSVFVIDTLTGKEIYRRYMTTYARSQLAFVGGRALAVSRYEDLRSWIEVLGLPDGAP